VILRKRAALAKTVSFSFPSTGLRK
jgi:hypothetical protein